jgi:hypothetical protein
VFNWILYIYQWVSNCFRFLPLQFTQGSALISVKSQGEIFSITKCIYLVQYMITIYTWEINDIYIAEIGDSICLTLDRNIIRYFLVSWYLLKPNERESWVTSSRCVFLSKVLIIHTNTKHMISKIVFYYKYYILLLPTSVIVK